VTLAKSDRGWISGVAGEGIVTIGDPRLKAPTARIDNVHDVNDLLTMMVDRLRSLNGRAAGARYGVARRSGGPRVRR
jgi:peptide deformylase